jgi:hypothetical protein
MYFWICFVEDRVARIIVINTEMAVETIIKDDHCITSAVMMPAILVPQISDALRSIVG